MSEDELTGVSGGVTEEAPDKSDPHLEDIASELIKQMIGLRNTGI